MKPLRMDQCIKVVTIAVQHAVTEHFSLTPTKFTKGAGSRGINMVKENGKGQMVRDTSENGN